MRSSGSQGHKACSEVCAEKGTVLPTHAADVVPHSSSFLPNTREKWSQHQSSKLIAEPYTCFNPVSLYLLTLNIQLPIKNIIWKGDSGFCGVFGDHPLVICQLVRWLALPLPPTLLNKNSCIFCPFLCTTLWEIFHKPI